MPTIRRRRLARRKKAGLRKRRAMRKMPRRNLNSNKMDRATVVEADEYTAVVEGGQTITHTLQMHPRATAVSKNFRFYRCKKVELEFIPYANVFAPGTAFPELYFQVDRTLSGGQYPNQGPGISYVPTKNDMLARGVTPVKWTSVLKRSYVPSVLRTENLIQNVLGSDVQSIAAVTATPVKYKWYATQAFFAAPPGNAASYINPTWSPGLLAYFGAAYFVDQPLANPGAVLGTIKMKVHWEFKQPLAVATSSVEPPVDVSGGLIRQQ